MIAPESCVGVPQEDDMQGLDMRRTDRHLCHRGKGSEGHQESDENTKGVETLESVLAPPGGTTSEKAVCIHTRTD